MLVAQGEETVIGRDEQVVTGDPGTVVKRRLVRLRCPTIPVPGLLDIRCQGPPGSQSPPVNIQCRSLGSGSPIIPAGTFPIIALAVPVIEGYVAHGAVGVSNQDRRAEDGHSALHILGKE